MLQQVGLDGRIEKIHCLEGLHFLRDAECDTGHRSEDNG